MPESFPKILITLGIIFISLGLLWGGLAKLGLGKLPGDFAIKGKNYAFYFPLMSSIILSIVLSIIMWFFRKGS